METRKNLGFLYTDRPFSERHIGPNGAEREAMLKTIGATSVDEVVTRTVPTAIQTKRPLQLPEMVTEREVLEELKAMLSKNSVFKSYIGLGYNDTITPGVIQRNILENPSWYTQYTPYQAEIAQGRLEALLNYQTMIVDLTKMEIANASMLDEGTAAAEAMTLAARVKGGAEKNRFFIADNVHPQTIDVVKQRAEPLGFEVVVGPLSQLASLNTSYFGALLQYPETNGSITDYAKVAADLKSKGIPVIAATDLLALTLLTPPGEWGADIVIGSSQRFGVPMGYGGPHAAFMATRDEFKRQMPGRLIGVSKDASGKPGLRLALQTREQHIRRDKATSNICTAQVLLAVMASMYAVYHGPEGLKRIASRVNGLTRILAKHLTDAGFKLSSTNYFDTLQIEVGSHTSAILRRAQDAKINLRGYNDTTLGVSIDETTTLGDISTLAGVFTGKPANLTERDLSKAPESIPETFRRRSEFLADPVFNSYHSEHELLRYITRLQSRDLSLTTSMIPLGSCTMKLNATAEMAAVTWPENAALHPFVPIEQARGYEQLTGQLERFLCEVTGLDTCSLQPNAGSQGEYAGLLVIRAYHLSRGDKDRNVCLIPVSAHGTNPASAVMAGMKVVTVACDSSGNVDVEDLKAKAQEHQKNLAALMVTYPSTHGVFEERICEITEIIHGAGGQVYMDGANLNAQVGLCRAGEFGVDVCHINLHKTFCIPHGGGGPGMGPICARSHLAPFMPGHPLLTNLTKKRVGGEKAIGPVSAAPWGSAAILVIPWVYMRLMGGEGLREATAMAIVNANYVASRLEPYFPVLYRGKNGYVAHECILDLRSWKQDGIEVEDIAKRLMDYGFHAPTVSFPVPGTLMVEPTESESKAELDRFCDAMISIHGEMKAVAEGKIDKHDNPLKNAPHTAAMVTATEWSHPYSREVAAYPAPWTKEHKFWPAVRRIDNVYGDRNLHCTCGDIGDYAN